VVEDPNDPDSKGLKRHAYLVFRDRVIEISNLKSQISSVLLKFGKSVDRRQYLATEATRPSRASTVQTDRSREVWLFFALKMAPFGVKIRRKDQRGL
jgi:hypothetical protein